MCPIKRKKIKLVCVKSDNKRAKKKTNLPQPILLCPSTKNFSGDALGRSVNPVLY